MGCPFPGLFMHPHQLSADGCPDHSGAPGCVTHGRREPWRGAQRAERLPLMRAGSTVCCGVLSRPGWPPPSPKPGLGESSGGADGVDGRRNRSTVSLIRMSEAILRPAEPRTTVLLLVVVGQLVTGHIQPIRKRHRQRVSRAHQECRSRTRSVISQGIDNRCTDDHRGGACGERQIECAIGASEHPRSGESGRAGRVPSCWERESGPGITGPGPRRSQSRKRHPHRPA
jgi:hypothetical protein